MEYEGELYAERLRRLAQQDDLAAGRLQWTDELTRSARMKLFAAWREALTGISLNDVTDMSDIIETRMLRSLAVGLRPVAMKEDEYYPNEHLLSLIEAKHEVLTASSAHFARQVFGPANHPAVGAHARYCADVNDIFQAHLVGLHLHDNSRLVPIDSQEMHDAVVAPMLYLLHNDPKFASAETAYQKALKELRNRDPGDAITDAATALQDVLLALGCKGDALGPLLRSAKTKGLLKGSDTPLTESIAKTIDWVSATRGGGEAHTGDPDIDMSDAWMVVHVVGALAIRLTESDSQRPS